MFDPQPADWSHKWDKTQPTVPQRRVMASHHPHSAATECERRAVLERLGAIQTNPVDERIQDIFDLGHAIEEEIQNKLYRQGEVIKCNHSIQFHPPNLEYPVCGEIDVIIEEPDGTLVPADVKSINKRGFEEGYGYWASAAIEEPQFKHLIQTNIYAYDLRAPHFYIIYYCKDNSEKFVWKVPFSEQAFQWSLDKFETIESWLEKGELPPRLEKSEVALYKITSKQGTVREITPSACRMCPYAYGCHADELIENCTDESIVKLATEFKHDAEESWKLFAN